MEGLTDYPQLCTPRYRSYRSKVSSGYNFAFAWYIDVILKGRSDEYLLFKQAQAIECDS